MSARKNRHPISAPADIVTTDDALAFFDQLYAEAWPVHECFALIVRAIVHKCPLDPEQLSAIYSTLPAPDAQAWLRLAGRAMAVV